MADRGDTHYTVRGLNLWFALSSILLLVATSWMMLDDWNRSWKKYQREFREIEVSRLEAEEQDLEQGGALETEAELQAKVDAANAALAGKQKELAEAEKALSAAKGERWKLTEEAKKAKSEYNWDRFKIEAQRLERGDESYGAERIEQAELKMNETAAQQEQAESAFETASQRVAELNAHVSEAEAALSIGTRDMATLRKRLEKLAPSAPADKLASVIRDAPGLDFIGPTLKVEKVVLDNLTFELNFTKKKRIDMCHTCHLAVDREGFEGEEHPFQTHPRLDLYLTAKSPHPLKDVGCTICHRGGGEALDFIRADHRPKDQEQEEAWHEEYHWHKQHHWDYPMLAADFTEASCIQCHKTSMELIADDAPTLTEGYQLVERYGCYSCHKVDWFPTSRRPGPKLTNIQAKATPDFVSAWIASPKSFRPTTWMPQFFHLENYAPDEPVVTSEYGEGREMLGQEWNDGMVAAVTSFILARAPKQELPPIPVEGDPVRGSEVFRVSGCLSCHNLAPYEGVPEVRDSALEQRGTNEHGPNLRGVASKVNAEWLYAWIKDPTAYWPETRMPNLRLSDQDAADITAYIMEDPDGYFTDVPADWDPKRVAMPEGQKREVMAEIARWFFARDGRSTIQRRLAGEDPKHRWDDLNVLTVAVGEKLVGNQGCFSCHEITGMEDMMPIGTELSNWGSKTVDRLDFGQAYKKDLAGRPKLDHEYREGWLMRKLHAPRSFDAEKVKNPIEKLRMPYFAFTDEEVRSIATFVVGLVDDEVQRARMLPSSEQMAMDAGMRAVRQNNCVACHVVDPGTVTFEDEHGVHTVTAELLPFEDELTPPPQDFEKLTAEIERVEAEEVGMRILTPEPDIGAKFGDRVFVPIDKLIATQPSYGGDFVSLLTDYYFYGQELFDSEAQNPDDAFFSVTADPDEEGRVQDVDGEFRTHFNEPYDKIRWTYAPPVLLNEGGKLQRQWFFSFLKDVIPLRPQIRVRMPSFHFADGEAEAIADYFALESVRQWPILYARNLRLSLGLSIDELAAESKLDARILRGIESGNPADTRSSFSKLMAFGTQRSFQMVPPVDPHYETIETRGYAYLAERAKQLPGHFGLAESIVTDAVNCYQCHFRLGAAPAADPIAWAPDLALTHERLREDWVLEWLRDPQSIYPGTSMPGNFAGDPPQYQDKYPNSNNEQQLQVVLEWLFNFDRVYMGSEN